MNIELTLSPGSMQPTVFIVVGTVLILLFTYLSFVLQPRLFPYDLSAGRPMVKAAAGGRAGHGAHMFLGIVEAAAFIAGVILVVMGCVMIGTSNGYG